MQPYAPAPEGSPQKGSFFEFLFSSWSGRIVLVNGVVFAFMAFQAGTLGMPGAAILDQFGAKDPVAIVNGEWWRLISSMFVHIGLLHFLFNSYATRVIGQQIETLLGMPWFLLTYFVAGLAGSIASAVFSISISAGASGAIMGLLGCGLYVENIIHKKIEDATGQRPRRGMYFINTIFILIFGMVVPNIDNAAHIGGLISGFVLGAAILRLKPNRLILVNRRVGWRLTGGLAVVMLAGLYLSLSPNYVANQYLAEAKAASSPIDRVYLLSKGLLAEPTNIELLFARAATILTLGDVRDAEEDVVALLALPNGTEKVQQLEKILDDAGLTEKQERLRALISEKINYL